MVGIIVQARMGSSRLPGKIMLDMGGETVLEHVVKRLRKVTRADQIIIATTDHPFDDIVADWSDRKGILCCRGSEEDVLGRYHLAAARHDLDVIVRITSDCPLIDYEMIDELLRIKLTSSYRFVTNVGPSASDRTFPRGYDAEVFDREMLVTAFDKATMPYHREHVTPYFYEEYQHTHYLMKGQKDCSSYRLTLDTLDDYMVLYNVIVKGDAGVKMWTCDAVINYLQDNPKLMGINSHIVQKPYLKGDVGE